ncbi:hypothetical protein FB446DRAFT_786928 [Lentinula raphanica]|nr:hypothetical protein FB446DRAFT_786928 [Lentinula raphanica]
MIIPTEKTLQDRLSIGLRTLISPVKSRTHSQEADSLPPDYEEVEGQSPTVVSTSPSSSIPPATPLTPTTPTLYSPNSTLSGRPDTEAPRSTSGALISVPTHPVNNISISHPFGTIDCAYTIDPTLTLFPPSTKGARIKSNIKLRTNVGSITADLNLVCGTEENTQTHPRATMDISSKMGTVDVKLRRTSATVPKIRLYASSRTGSLSILIPSNFHGFIVGYTKIGRLSLTPSLQSAAVVLREDSKLKRVFVGDPGVLRNSNQSDNNMIAPSRLRDEVREAGLHIRQDGNEDDSSSESESEEASGSLIGRWQGDEIVLKTPLGSIEVGYSDDHEPVSDSEADVVAEEPWKHAGRGRGLGHDGRGWGHDGRGGHGHWGNRSHRGHRRGRGGRAVPD